MILMLTKHISHSFSCLTLYIFLFCRNKENETKSKKFGQELRKICKEEAVVATIEQIQEDLGQENLGVVTTMDHYCHNILGVVMAIA